MAISGQELNNYWNAWQLVKEANGLTFGQYVLNEKHLSGDDLEAIANESDSNTAYQLLSRLVAHDGITPPISF